jgi:hypothetical protein
MNASGDMMEILKALGFEISGPRAVGTAPPSKPLSSKRFSNRTLVQKKDAM